MRRVVFALLIGLLAVSGVPVEAAEDGRPASRTPAGPGEVGQIPDFGEVVEVSVVNVDVTVLDRKGRPVTDLESGDFEVLEDGRPVDIRHFSLVAAPMASPAVEGGAEAPPGGDGTRPSGATTSDSEPEAALWLTLYFDNLHSRLFDRNRSIAALRRLLEAELPAGTRLSVASYDRSLTMRQDFTEDVTAIDGVLEAMELVRADGDRQEDERRRLIKVIERSVSAKDALERVRPFADQARGELWGSLSALERTVEWLSRYPGRKAILFVSGGLPLKPGAGLFNAIEYKWPGLLGIHEMMLFDQSEEFERIGRFASASGVTIHTLDNAGVRPVRSVDVEQDLILIPTLSANLDGDIRTNLQLPLRQLADATGGRAIINRNNALPELEELVAELGTYYSLGYVPDRDADDRFHRIEVRVRRRGVRLHHREGYRDKPRPVAAGGA